MAWWMKKPAAEQLGSVLFRGTWPQRLEDLSFEKRGLDVRRGKADERQHWTAEVTHPAWGSATIMSIRDPPLPMDPLIAFDTRLTDDEKAAMSLAGSMVALSAEARDGNVLVDRKKFLRFLHAVMGDDGIAAVDHTAQAFWSRSGLEDELAHDAELDIEAIHTLHLVGDEGDDGHHWLHSHGLKEIGYWDFDILDPSPALNDRAHDLLRAIAFAIVEERFRPGSEPFPVIQGAEIAAVRARDFLAGAASGDYPRYRRDQDEEHVEGHAVVCEPEAHGFLSRLFRGTKPRASGFLRGPFPDEVLIQFSTSAGELMARRATQMLPLLRALVVELAGRELVPLVKLGYRTDGGAADDREHLWFHVHGFQGDEVDATLVNQPFGVSRLHKDERGLHPLALLSDWAVLTRLGTINPRQTRALRIVRANIDSLPVRT